MRLRNVILVAITILLFNGCNSNPEDPLKFIEGYWEIKQVKKGNNIVKEYNISTTVDYFKVNDDLTGYRKKVSPTLEGSFIITQNQAPFILKTENDSLNIYYNLNNVITKETIIKATKEELIINNSLGFSYIYKPFNSLKIDF